jgi:hypothetical protein
MYDSGCVSKVAKTIEKLRASNLSQIRFSLSTRRGAFESPRKDEWCALSGTITPKLFPSLHSVQIDSIKSHLVPEWKLAFKEWFSDLDARQLLVVVGFGFPSFCIALTVDQYTK